MSHKDVFVRSMQIGAVIASSALVLSACSSSSSTATSPTTTSPAAGSTSAAAGSTSAAAGSSAASGGSAGGTGTIVIGYVASQSGSQANNGLQGVAAAHAWQEATNAAGGINGKTVQIKDADTKSTVPGALSAFKGFASDTSVDAVLMTDLVSEGAMGDEFKSANMAVMSGGGSDPSIWSKIPGLFQPVSGTSLVVTSYAAGAKLVNAKTLGFAACQEVASCAENAVPAAADAKAAGIAFAGTQLFSASATDYTAQCLAFVGKNVDAIAMNIGIDTGVRVMSDCLQQGYKGVFVMPNSGFDQAKVAKVPGVSTVDVTQGFPWWASDPAVKTYRDAMTKYSPDQSYSSGNATSVWAMLELLKKGLQNEKPATISRASVLSALYSIKGETLGGLLPQPTTFTKGQPSVDVLCNWAFKFNAGDANPTTVAPTGKSGNGATGDLASRCQASS